MDSARKESSDTVEQKPPQVARGTPRSPDGPEAAKANKVPTSGARSPGEKERIELREADHVAAGLRAVSREP